MNLSKQELRREQILHAALQVVVQNGYEKSRMDDVVQKAHLSKGAIYWYYKSKKELYLDLVRYWVNRYSVVLNHIVEEEAPAAEQLQGVFTYFIDQFEKDPTVFKALVEFWSLSGKDPEFKNKLQKIYSSFLELLERIIAKGVTSGEFKAINTKITALSIMVNIEGINWFTLFEMPGVRAREYIETITAFILAGLTKTDKK
jgi:AcrR family transcriptional regulator